MFSSTLPTGIWNSAISGCMGDSVPLPLTPHDDTHEVKMMLSTPVFCSAVIPIEQSMHQNPKHGSAPQPLSQLPHRSCWVLCSTRLYTVSSW